MFHSEDRWRSQQDRTNLEISLAYQGGGAKVVELLAAVVASRAAEAPGRLKIFRCSGASAGAIAAAMHATGCDVHRVIAGAPALRTMVRRHFPASRLKTVNALGRLLRGKAVFDERHVRAIIVEMFRLGGVDADRPIRDVVLPGMQLRILRSDIRFNNSPTATEASESRLADALVDSAAIPFAFRVPSTTSSPEILDGGLFQNLPAKAALDGLVSGQVAVGSSFARETSADLQSASPIRYGAAVLSSLLNERVEDACLRIKTSNVIEIPSRRSTFEFETIFSADLPATFSEDVSTIGRKIENWRKNFERLDGPDWHSDHPIDVAEQAKQSEIEINRFYEEACDNGYHADQIHHEVVYQSFNKDMPDIYRLHVTLDGSKNVGLQFLRFSFYDSDSGSLKSAKVEVFDGAGKPRNAMSLPFRPAGNRGRATLICLDRPLSADDTVVVIKTEESFSGMLEYDRDGFISQTLSIIAGRKVDRMLVTVHFPEGEQPLHYGDASIARPKDRIHLDRTSGLQLESSTSIIEGERAGCVTMRSVATSTGPPEQKRFVQVVYYRDA